MEELRTQGSLRRNSVREILEWVLYISFYMYNQRKKYAMVDDGKDILGLAESIGTKVIDECSS